MVIANNQNNGKGTNGRKWKTRLGDNLTFSMLLIPNCKIEKINELTVILAKAVIRAINKVCECRLEIKYPNDIMLNNKKMCGILTESTTKGEVVKKIIIGIGINLNQVKFDKEIEEIATSLKKEFGKNFSKEKIISNFFNEFEKDYLNILKE